MTYDPMRFSDNLIKGRIAETLFEQMLRDAGGFTILAFGYENILPELAHCQDRVKSEATMEIIRRAPDFAVINNKTHDVHLIEVKYMADKAEKYVLIAAQKMFDSWKPSYLFIANPAGFFYGRVSDLVENGGKIKPLGHDQISADIQEAYLALLNKYISRHNRNELVENNQ